MFTKLSEELTKHGNGIKALFMVLLVYYLIELTTYLVFVFEGNEIITILVVFVLLLVPYLFYKSNRLDYVFGTFLFLPIFGVGGFVLYNFYQVSMHISSLIILTVMGFHALLLGLTCAYIYSKFTDNFKSYYLSSLFYTTLISIIGVVWVFASDLLFKVNEQLKAVATQMGTDYSGVVLMFNISDVFNSYLAFALVFILFNLPYLFYFKKYQEHNTKLLLLHLIPIAIFLILGFLVTALGAAIITQPLPN